MDIKIHNHAKINISARIPINIDIDEDSIVLNSEIKKSVFIPNTVTPAKGVRHVKILNTNGENLIIKYFDVDIEPLSNYHILKVRNNVNKQFKTC